MSGGVSPVIFGVSCEDRAHELRRAQPLALERQEGEFVRGVEYAEVAREFQAIDELGFGFETNVLGPQVAVRFDHTPGMNPPIE